MSHIFTTDGHFAVVICAEYFKSHVAVLDIVVMFSTGFAVADIEGVVPEQGQGRIFVFLDFQTLRKRETNHEMEWKIFAKMFACVESLKWERNDFLKKIMIKQILAS